MNSPEPGIIITGLTKRYDRANKLALDNLSLTVNQGEIYGLLGPNGAGKSTTLRLLMNFIQPTGGTATVLGNDIVKDSIKIKESLGYLTGDNAVYPKMSGKDFLDYMNDLYPTADRAYTKQLTKKLNAELDKKIGDLSRGNKQKISIIQAFMHKPQVLILDEPTSGLDPLMQEVFAELLGEAKERKTTIIMSSHVLSEVQKMCDRVGIIREGKLASERNIAEMASEAAQTFDITFSGKVPLSELKQLKAVRISGHTNNRVTIHVHGKLAPLFAVLANYDVVSMDTQNLDLEEVFLKFYQHEEHKQ